MTVSAQIQNTDITLNLSPEYPAANENATANVTSYVTDLKQAYLVWKLNSEVRLSGIGKTQFSFTLGEVNSENILTVDIQTTDGKNLTQSLTIAGTEVDLLWEATNSYTPPFYKGKALFAREGEVKVVAIPSVYQGGKKINSNNLSYKWEKDDNPDQGASGFGKNSFSYKNSFINKANEIAVTVSDINNKTNTTKKIIITPITPKILFYKKDAGGIKLENKVNNNYLINKEGESIVAVPYFFSPKNINTSDLKINWFVNGEQVLNPIAKNELFIKPAEGKSGQAQVRILIDNLNTLFQNSEAGFSINF